ncbi:MAG: recombinase family protein [Anaeromicrobium sp.]|jgi:DNA invertase Pin-like site-specific DNA recombinase|uniref:recombinase family protein n=1 Tax=Anaeromicrobium sp. TaxID=1929132 RepID=UPI0025DB58BC|nr:helix-turn-helix domain-containing protein [Anaeromicrobium sp.]MCT4593692.1 recombinase family protein [Anaeromicrobium sp.]
MIYAYMQENSMKGINIDNSSLIKLLNESQLRESQIFVDAIDSKERADLRKLIKEVIKAKDILIVRSIADLSDNFRDLIKTLTYLEDNEIELVSLEELDYIYKAYYQIFNDFIKIDNYWKGVKRIKGIEKAKSEGRIGRKKDITKISDAIKLYNLGYKIKDIKRITGISTSTLYRELKNINKK